MQAGARARACVRDLVVFAVVDAIVGKVVSGKAMGLAFLEAVLRRVRKFADTVRDVHGVYARGVFLVLAGHSFACALVCVANARSGDENRASLTPF